MAIDKTLLWGVAAGAGIAIIAGGIAVMAVGKKRRGGMSSQQMAAIARLSRAQHPKPYRGPVVSPVVAVPLIGRPFSDPFHHETGGASMWGSGPWAHRTPRLRPVPPHH